MGLVNPDHPRQDPSDATVNPPLTMQHQWQQEHQPEPDAPRENRFSTDENRRNFNRTQSFNTTASGYLSRNSSSNQMYQRGYEYEDDDASSTRYGLGGEVVISRNYTVRVPQRPDETDASAPSMEHQHRLQRHRPRFINELGPVASAISADEDSVRSPPTNIRSPASSHDGNVASDNSSRNANENEPSALQSILNVMNDDDSLAFHSSDPLLSPAETIFRQ